LIAVKQIEALITIGTILTAVIGGTVIVEQRYAKSADVQQQMDGLYAKTLKLRILELELKPANQFTPADRALLLHLRQELKEATD
jgi:hypothetical protein